MNTTLSEFARQAIPRLERLVAAEEISVPDAAKLLKKDVEFIRKNLPVIVHGPKSHHVKLSDIEAFQAKRTVWPQNVSRNFPANCAVGSAEETLKTPRESTTLSDQVRCKPSDSRGWENLIRE